MKDIKKKKGMKRGSSARFLSSCCPSSCSSFPRVVYPRLRVISPFFKPVVSPSYPSSSFSSCPSSSSSCPSSSSSSRPSSFASSSPLPLPPPVAGFPTSLLIVVVVGVPTQQSRWGAGVSHHLRGRRRIAPPPVSPLLVVSPLFLLVVYTPRRWFMPFVVRLCPSSLGYDLRR